MEVFCGTEIVSNLELFRGTEGVPAKGHASGFIELFPLSMQTVHVSRRKKF